MNLIFLFTFLNRKSVQGIEVLSKGLDGDKGETLRTLTSPQLFEASQLKLPIKLRLHFYVINCLVLIRMILAPPPPLHSIKSSPIAEGT